MKIYRLLVVFLVFFLVSPLSSAEIYKWVDDKGVVHFSDRPPSNSSEEPEDQQASSSDSKPQNNSSPVAENQNAAPELDVLGILEQSSEELEAPGKPTVEIYETSWCGYCKKARQFFRSKGIEFAAYDIEKDERAARRMRALTPHRGVPFVVINGHGIQGYSEKAYEAALEN